MEDGWVEGSVVTAHRLTPLASCGRRRRATGVARRNDLRHVVDHGYESPGGARSRVEREAHRAARWTWA